MNPDTLSIAEYLLRFELEVKKPMERNCDWMVSHYHYSDENAKEWLLASTGFEDAIAGDPLQIHRECDSRVDVRSRRATR